MEAKKSSKEFSTRFICTERGGYRAKDGSTKRAMPGRIIEDADPEKMYYSVVEDGKKVYYLRRGFKECEEIKVVATKKAKPAAKVEPTGDANQTTTSDSVEKEESPKVQSTENANTDKASNDPFSEE